MKLYARLLSLLRGRDPREQDAIRADAARLLDEARSRGQGAVAATWLGLIADLIAGSAQDLSRATRSLLRAPGFALTVSLLLGLGVAATTTLFALVDAVILKPLPYADPDRLMMVWESNIPQNRVREGPSPGDLNDWVASNDAFETLTGWWTAQATLRGRDGSAPVAGVQVTRGFFEVFGRAPILGRTFSGDDYNGATSIPSGRSGGGEPVLVLSYRLWQSLGADPALIGNTLFVEGRNWRVLGVMPADFAVPDTNAGFWTPWDMRESYKGARFTDGPPREARFLRAVGRLKPDVSREGASQRMAALAARIAADHPRTNENWGVELVPLQDELIRSSRTELLLVFGAVFGLLLLVCANVASLAIARGMARARETAIRLALGAGSPRLLREHLADTLLCAALTMLFAIALTASSLGAAIAFAPADIPRLQEVSLNSVVIAFAVGISLLATIVGVFIPGLRGGSAAIASTLKDGAPVSGQHAGRIRRALVVAEIGVTVVLLVGAGLLARSFASLQRVDPGFDTRNLLVLRIAPDVTKYRGAPLVNDYYSRVFASIRELPGVASTAAVTVLPMSTIGSDFYRPYWLEGARPAGNVLPQANVRMASPGYFSTLGLPLVAGREFSDRDAIDAPRVIVINESLARTVWPGQDPIGRSLILDYQGGATAREVVGIVRDARYKGPRSEPAPELFIPHAQNPYLVMNVVVRTTIDPAALAPSARAQALKVDPEQPVHSVTTMERLFAETMQEDRFAMLFVALFAIAGLVTAATGVYALLAYTVAQRRREIAVRMAIGASSSSVARLIVMESMLLAVAGCVVGAAGVAAISRLARSILFGIAPQDPVTLLTTAVVLVVVVLAASWLPARRAAKINPVAAMRI